MVSPDLNMFEREKAAQLLTRAKFISKCSPGLVKVPKNRFLFDKCIHV